MILDQQTGLKRCPACAEHKPASEFKRSSRRPDGLHLYCKPCTNARRRERYAADPEFRASTARRIRKYVIASQAETADQAANYGKEWTGPELEIAARDDLTAREAALMLGRTHYTLRQMRRLARNESARASA